MNQQRFELGFNGDEIIVTSDKDRLIAHVKIQTARDEYRQMKFTFETQTQMERLLPSMIKALK